MKNTLQSNDDQLVTSARSRARFGLAGAIAAGALAIGLIGAAGLPAQSVTAATASAAEITAQVGDASLAEQVAAKCMPSVGTVYVLVETDTMSGIAQGSCEVIDASGVLLTNYHVIDGGTKIQVAIADGTFDAEVVGSDPTSDIAVLRIDPGDTELVPLEIGSSADLNVGQWVMTLGAPKGESESASQGIVSGLNRTSAIEINDEVEAYYVGLIQSDAMINEGSSGGAMVNANGELVGITTINATQNGDFAGMSYAIPIDYVMNVAGQILQTGVVEHPLFGASILSISNAYFNGYYQPGGDDDAWLLGAYVYSVVDGLGAADAGVKPGDIVISFDGSDVYSPEDLILGVRSHAIGDTVKVVVDRNGEEVEFDVTLSSDQDDAAVAANGASSQQDEGERRGGSHPFSLFEFLGDGNGSDDGDDRSGDQGDNDGLRDGDDGRGYYGYGNGNDGYGYYGYYGYGYPGYGYGYGNPGYGDYGYYGYYGYPGYGYGYPGYGRGYGYGNGYGGYGYGSGSDNGYSNGGGQGQGQGDQGLWDFWSQLGDALGFGF